MRPLGILPPSSTEKWAPRSYAVPNLEVKQERKLPAANFLLSSPLPTTESNGQDVRRLDEGRRKLLPKKRFQDDTKETRLHNIQTELTPSSHEENIIVGQQEDHTRKTNRDRGKKYVMVRKHKCKLRSYYDALHHPRHSLDALHGVRNLHLHSTPVPASFRRIPDRPHTPRSAVVRNVDHKRHSPRAH